MTLTRYQPWGLLNELQQDINRSFSRYADGNDDTSVIRYDWTPAVDIREEQDRYIVEADVPGVNLQDIEITAEAGSLSLRGERKVEQAAEGETSRSSDRPSSRHSERAYGQFYRRFTLPETVDTTGIKATGKNGVLQVTIPKVEKAKPQRISIDVQ